MKKCGTTHCEVLGRNGVEQLQGDGNTHLRQVAQQLPCHAQALVDLKGAVQIGVVDQALPCWQVVRDNLFASATGCLQPTVVRGFYARMKFSQTLVTKLK